MTDIEELKAAVELEEGHWSQAPEIQAFYEEYGRSPSETKQEAAQELIALKENNGWLPIETAPTLGQWYLVCCDKWVSDYRHKIQVLGFADSVDEDGIFWISDQDGSRIFPTHWKPLPQPPKQENE